MERGEALKESRAEEYNNFAVYYIRITDNSGHCSGLLYETLRSIVRKLKGKYIGVKSLGHGSRSFNKPHVHAIVLTKEKADLKALWKLIPKGWHFKIKRLKNLTDLGDCYEYITEHARNPEKRGFLSKAKASTCVILSSLLLGLLLLASLNQAPLLSGEEEKRKGVGVWLKG